MQNATALFLTFSFLAGMAQGQPGPPAQETADIQIYRITSGIAGPVGLPGLADGARVEDFGQITQPFVVKNPTEPSIPMGNVAFALDGGDVRWGNQAQPVDPGILLLGQAERIPFSAATGLTVSEAAPLNGAKDLEMGVDGIEIKCVREFGNGIRLMVRFLRRHPPYRTEHGTVVKQGPGTSAADVWLNAVLQTEPEQWAGLICGLTTVTAKPAGSLLILVKTHGEPAVAPPQEPITPAYTVEMRFLDMSKDVAEALRARFPTLTNATVTPEGAEVFDLGSAEAAGTGCAPPSAWAWLEEQSDVELLSAPRITLSPLSGPAPPATSAPAFKVLLRQSGQTDTRPPTTDLPATLREMSESLYQFLVAQQARKPGIICDIVTVYDADPDTGDVLRNHYGAMAGVALEPLPGEDALHAFFYFNMKTRHEHKRGLRFWKAPPLPTYTETPVSLEAKTCISTLILVKTTANDRYFAYSACIGPAGVGQLMWEK